MRGSLPSPLRGVNLGGFLVLEPYVKPSLFRMQGVCMGAGPDFRSHATCAIDEHSLSEMLGTRAAAVMREHWETWVTLAELKELRDAGINSLRIPVGYWIVSPEAPYVTGGLHYLLRVCEWAAQLGMRVLVEMHAAPGYQNNMDHSGWKDHMGWQASPCAGEPSKLQSEYGAEYRRVLRTLDVLTQHGHVRECTADDGHDDEGGPCGTVFGVGLLNEPVSFDKKHPVDHAGLARLYSEVLAEEVPRHLFAVVDIFEGFDWLVEAGLLNRHPRLLFDKHRYVGFSEKGMRGARNAKWLDEFACAALHDGFDLANASAVAAQRGERMADLVFGEWSVATNDCMPWLGGAYHEHTNYECCGLGDCDATTARRPPSHWSSEEVAGARRYAQLQMAAMEGASGGVRSLGHFYWNFKTEEPSQWSYLDGLRYGFLPRPADQDNNGADRCSSHRLPVYCIETDPGCDKCLAREGHNATCKPWPPAPPVPPPQQCDTTAILMSSDPGGSSPPQRSAPAGLWSPINDAPAASWGLAVAAGVAVVALLARKLGAFSSGSKQKALDLQAVAQDEDTPYVALQR